MPWLDTNDAVSGFYGALPKVSENCPQGVSTYGFWEYISWMDGLVFDMWMTASTSSGMGLCGGLVISALATRMIFMPIGFYG